MGNRIGLETRKVCVDRVLEALKNGENTDCVFEIGPDGQSQEFNACKFALATRSEYFAGLLRSPLTPPGPIRIKRVQPKVFQMVLEFAHTGDLVSKPGSFEECIQLACAADEFLLEDLGHLCSKMLQKKYINSGNVWKTLSDHHLVVYVSAACQKLLCNETEKLLKNPAFLEISEQALAEFLNFKMMNVSSEMVLVNASLAYAKANLEERVVFRRAALPHLRLLTLTEKELAKVAHFLTLEEKMFLLKKQNPLLANEKISDKVNLSSNKTTRIPSLVPKRREQVLELVPADGILDLETIFRKSKYTKLSANDNKFTLRFITEKCMKINDIEVFCPLDFPNDYFDENLLKSIKRKRKDGGLLKDVTMKFSIEVTCNDLVRNCQWEVPSEQLVSNSVVHYDKSIFLPMGSNVTVEVTLTGACCIREISVQDLVSEDCEMYLYFYSMKDDFAFALFDHHSMDQGYDRYNKLDEESACSIFKSIRYELI